MVGDAFISYRHGHDDAYVEQLAGFLEGAGIPVWYDDEIVSGDRWLELIQKKIDACSALLVVMTQSSADSRWVNLEIQRAEDIGKPILPLLLSGRPFFRLADLQYDDVQGGRLPSARFLDRLRGYLGWPNTGSEDWLDVAYRVSYVRSGFGSWNNRRVQLTVTAGQDCDGVDLAVAVSAGEIMPLCAGDGTVVHRLSQLSFQAGIPTTFIVPIHDEIQRPYWVRCFVVSPADVIVLDPIVDEMRAA